MKRLAVVTGGARGIGRAISIRLARDGFDVIAAARGAVKLPDNIRFAALDVTRPDAVREFFAKIPRLDLLVNNAGLAGANALGDQTAWDAIIATNLTGTYLCCAAAAEKLTDGVGRIVNIASVLGLRGVPDQTAYCAAKHGVIGLTRALALALAPRGITVNAICPGWVATDMAARRFAELGITEAEAGANMPIGRVVRPEEVADIVAFLVGQPALTGLALPVDGGGLAAA